MSFRMMRAVRGVSVALALTVPAVAALPTLAQVPPGVTIPPDATQALACLQTLSDGVVLTDDVMTHFIATYSAVTTELAAAVAADPTIATAADQPTYLCTLQPGTEFDARVTPSGFASFHEWTTTLAAVSLAQMIGQLDPSQAAILGPALGVSASPENVAAVQAHLADLQAVMAAPAQ